MSVTFYTNYTQYSRFDAAAEPSISDQVATMSGGETTGPLYDLVDNRRTNTLSIDTNGETQAATIQIETTSSHTNNSFIIDNHNLLTADAYYLLGESGTAIEITSAYSGTYGSEMSADTISGVGDTVVTVVSDDLSVCNFDNVTGDTWQIVFADVDDDNFDADITIGELFFSFSIDTDHNPELQPIFGYKMPGSSYRETDGGQRYGFSTHREYRRSWRLTWKYITDSVKSNLEFAYRVAQGSKYPFYIDLSGPLGNTNPTLFYVRFMNDLNFTGLTKDAWQVTVDIEEEI